MLAHLSVKDIKAEQSGNLNDLSPIYDFTQLNLKLTKEIVHNNFNAFLGISKIQSENAKPVKVSILTPDKKVIKKKKVSGAVSSYNKDKLTKITSKSFSKILPNKQQQLISEKAQKIISLHGKSNSKLLEIKNKTTAGTGEPSKRLIENKQWILAQKSDLYILLFLGSKHKKEIINFAQDENIKGQFAVFETNRNGNEWYHLILGTFKNRDAAKLAIQQIPEQLNKPWIRPIKDIQKVISKLLN